jgi:hypothetical protein
LLEMPGKRSYRTFESEYTFGRTAQLRAGRYLANPF